MQGKAIVNSISLKEGEEKFLRAGAAGAALRRGRGGHGLRREGPGRRRRAQVEICQRAYQHADREGRLPPQDIIFDPNILTVATGIEEHNNYAVDFIEATRRIKQNLPLVQGLRRRQQHLVLVPRQQRRCARRCTRRFCTTPSRPAWTWASSTPGSLAVYEEIPQGSAGTGGGRAAQSPAGCHRAAGRVCRNGEAAGRQDGSARSGLAQRAGRGAAQARAGQGHRRFHRADVEEAAAEVRPAAGRHRRPADGRHEHGRRPVRLRQDVPAAGGEERARDEEGRGLSAAVHGAGKSRRRQGRQAARARS